MKACTDCGAKPTPPAMMFTSAPDADGKSETRCLGCYRAYIRGPA